MFIQNLLIPPYRTINHLVLSREGSPFREVMKALEKGYFDIIEYMASINDGFYNYYLQNKNLFNITMYILLAGAMFLMIYLKDSLVSNNDVSVFYYTFSTIVQGFLALVGFLGGVSIYKLQLIENEATKLSDNLKESIALYKGPIAYTYSWIETMNECQAILSNKDSNWKINEINSAYTKFCKLRDQKKPIRNTIIDFTFVSMINIMFALINLSLSKIFITKELLGLALLFLIINIITSFFSAKIAISVIRNCLGYDFTL